MPQIEREQASNSLQISYWFGGFLCFVGFCFFFSPSPHYMQEILPFYLSYHIQPQALRLEQSCFQYREMFIYSWLVQTSWPSLHIGHKVLINTIPFLLSGVHEKMGEIIAYMNYCVLGCSYPKKCPVSSPQGATAMKSVYSASVSLITKILGVLDES